MQNVREKVNKRIEPNLLNLNFKLKFLAKLQQSGFNTPTRQQLFLGQIGDQLQTGASPQTPLRKC